MKHQRFLILIPYIKGKCPNLYFFAGYNLKEK